MLQALVVVGVLAMPTGAAANVLTMSSSPASVPADGATRATVKAAAPVVNAGIVQQQITQTFVLDPEMRERLAKLNPAASAKVAHRLLEAHERHYWNPDPETLAALRAAGEELDDRLEGIYDKAAA